jgi:hypothetical protein
VGQQVRRLGLITGAETFTRAGRRAKAEPLLRELVGVARQADGADSATLAEYLAVLGQNLVNQHKSVEAEAILRECLAIRQKKFPHDWTTFHTRSVLGGALLRQKKYAAAEPLLREGYRGMRQRPVKMPLEWQQARLSEGLIRLVQLYDAWGKKDEAARWRKELEALKTPMQAKPPKEK